MKILIVSAAYPPYTSGVATATANLATFLSKSHQITLVAGGNYQQPHRKFINHNFSAYLFPGVQIKRQKAFLTIPYPYPKKILSIITAFQPEVIHLQDFSPISFSVLSLARKLKIPVVMTHHFTAEYIVKTLVADPKLSNTLSNSQLTQQIIYRLVNLFYNRCQLLVVPNPNLIPLFKKAGLKTPIVAIPNGIYVKNFHKKTRPANVLKLHSITQPQMILFVGRLEIDKNLEVLVEAFRLVHQYNPTTSLVLVGDGNKKTQLLNQAKKLHLIDAVYLLGKIDNTDSALSHLYNAASLFASASIIENQSVAFIEAMAAGLPIVSAKTAITVNSSFNGLEFEPGNTGALAVCLQKILIDQKLKKTISKYNRHAGRQYDIAITSRQYIKAYQSLITI
ncbi:MAG: glycosyltransferase [Patescibacteria group bacterium]|nr:glycosyltransferase [Candidatus Beckwithbacteria bacterium]MDZ4228726.1 glycosyltransferase [Patescibacteria group bacterium]